MAITLTKVPNFTDIYGRTRITTYDVTLDTSYPLTNGYVIQARDVGLSAFKGATFIGGNKAAGAILPALDLGTNSKGNAPTSAALRIFAPTGGGTAASTVSAPSFSEGAVTIGGTATGTIPTGATPVTSTSASPAVSVPATGLTGSIAGGALTAGIAKEFANATDLSSITLRIEFRGL